MSPQQNSKLMKTYWHKESILDQDWEDVEMILLSDHAEALLEIESERNDLLEVLRDKHLLTLELDKALNGDDHAEQASLCDLIPVAKALRKENERLTAVFSEEGIRVVPVCQQTSGPGHVYRTICVHCGEERRDD